MLILPYGWRKYVSKEMKISSKTAYNILFAGKYHPRYNELINILRTKYNYNYNYNNEIQS